MLVRTAIDDYRYGILNLSEKSQKEYLSKLAIFCEWAESQQPPIAVEDIKQSTIRRFIEHIKTRNSPRTGRPVASITIHGYQRCLKAWLNWLSREDTYEDVVSNKVANHMEMQKVPEKIIEVFSDDQLKALFAACDQERTSFLKLRTTALLSVFIDTGIRCGEATSLLLENCHLEPHDAYLKVHGKGDKWREVPLHSRSLAALRKYIRHRSAPKEEQHVFLSRSGTPLTVWGTECIISRLGNRARIEGVRCSPHTFRHTFGVRSIQAGMSIYDLSRIMGHSGGVKVTEIYLRAAKAKDVRRNAPSVLDSVLSSKKGKR